MSTRHESYGILSINRVTGGADLFGSPIPAQHFVRISISEGSQKHSHGRTWNSADALICEIDMSEVQFAEAITSLNCGVGVPCTLIRARDGENVRRFKDCPPQTTEAKQTREEFKRTVQDKLSAMEEAKDELMKLTEGLSERKRKQIGDAIDGFTRLFTDSAPFLMESFEENVAKIVATAKVEISAHAELTARNTGIMTLTGGDVPSIGT